jgi:hypothetical protein
MPPADRASWIALAVGALLAAALIGLKETDETAPVRAPAPAAETTPEAARAPTTVDAAEPLLLGDTAVRALRATRVGGTVTVVLRVRNNTGRAQRLNAGGFALVLDGTEAQALPATSVPAGESATVRPRFAGVEGDAPELDVTGWDDGGTGTIRLEVDGA